MVKSEFANRLDKVQGVIYRSLKEIGYRKQGRTYNNALDSSLVHVINFQMGQYPVGNQEETPFRKNLYGYFSVNLGVFVPKVYLLTSRSQEIPQFIRVGHCEVRKRLGDLMTPSKDVWWNLVGDSKELSATILGLLKEDGLPYLERFRSNEDVVRE